MTIGVSSRYLSLHVDFLHGFGLFLQIVSHGIGIVRLKMNLFAVVGGFLNQGI